MSGEDKPHMPSAAINPHDHKPFRAHHPSSSASHSDEKKKPSDKMSGGQGEVKLKSQLTWELQK